MKEAMTLSAKQGLPAWWPVTVLLFSASLWGLSWLPLKGFAGVGVHGPVLVLLTYGVVGLFGLPWLIRQRAQWRGETRLLLAVAFFGGWANTAFVNALVIGDVVRVMLLFYLSPVWAVLGGRLFLGEAVSRRRGLALVLALTGAFLVVGGFDAFNAALSAADLLALSAGLAFAGNNLVARAAQTIPTPSKTIAVFAGCGVASCLMLLVLQATGAEHPSWPTPTLPLAAALVAYAFCWTVLATATWQYGVTHMEAGRSGVIMIAELLVGLVSAMLIGGEVLSLHEWIGGALITAAALLEATDTTPASTQPSRHLSQEKHT
jgi:drug/metabolite transporter (DMT)-like permease